MRTVVPKKKKREAKPKQVKEELQSEPVIYSRTALSAAHATHFYYYSDFFSFLFCFFGWSGLPATCRAVSLVSSVVQRCLLILQLLILFHAVYAN